jgi:sialidase-1
MTGIGASSEPAMLRRLASGRLILIWNQLYPSGKDSCRRVGGQSSEREASWHCEELSIAFSDDERRTWSDPVVVTRIPGEWLSCSYPFEHNPRELWLTTMQEGVRARFSEADFTGGNAEESAR